MDWTYGLEDAEDLTLVRDAVDAVVKVGAQAAVGSTEAENVIAASEVIARLLGKGGERSSYTKAVDAWVESHSITPPSALIAEARAALDRVTVAPSDLLELWEEAGDADGWIETVRELKGRLS